jgi:hypothetical protein
MRLSIEEHKKLSDIYENNVLIEMDVGGVVGGLPTSGGNLENVDDYATGDNRIPHILGHTQTRNGKLKNSKKKKKLARKLRPNKL